MVFAMAICGCWVFQPPASPQSYLDVPTFQFPATSLWSQKIATNATVDPASDAYVRLFASGKPAHSPWGLASIPVYYAPENPRPVPIPVLSLPAPLTGLRAVPMPDHALPYRESDSPLTLIDSNRAISYEFWNLHLISGRFTAGNGGVFDLTGNGVANRMVTRACGFSQLAGLIWPKEIRAKHIPHALVLSWKYTKKSRAVEPAVATDGWSEDPGAIPMGARVQLDPSLDLNTIAGIDEYQKAIFRALQEYGAFIADTGGFSVFLVSPQCFSEDPYTAIPSYNVAGQVIDLSNLPVERLRVLALGADVTNRATPSYPDAYYY